MQTLDSFQGNGEKEKKRSSNLLFYTIQSFLSFAQNLSFQFLPIYAKKLGADAIQMGLLTATQNVFSTFFSPFWGKRSDNYGRKVFMLLGGFIATFSAILMTVVNTPSQVIITVGINAFGLSILIPAWQGAIADYTTGKTRGGFMGRLVGISYVFVTIALTVYALTSPYIGISELSQYRLIIGLSALNFGMIVIASWFLIDIRTPSREKTNEGIFSPLNDPIFRRFLQVILVWWFFMSLAWSYFPTVISEVAMASPAQVAWIGIIATIVQAIASYRLADYIDIVGARKSMTYGFLTFSVVPFVFAFAKEWWHIIPAQIIAGIGIGFGFTAMQTYILNIAGEEKAGSYMGTYNIFWGIVTFIGSLLGGVVLSWLENYLGELEKALTFALIFITVCRIFTNIIMVKYLPEPPVHD